MADPAHASHGSRFLGEELFARVKAEADARGLSPTWLGRKLMAEALDDLRPADEWRLTRPRRPDSHRFEDDGWARCTYVLDVAGGTVCDRGPSHPVHQPAAGQPDQPGEPPPPGRAPQR